MLSLLLNCDHVERLADELLRARQKEIGGVLVGEQLGPNAFRLVDFSVQRAGGTTTCFVCNPAAHREFIEAFFERTGADYSRFNYLGEWHSHPLFSVVPSSTDVAQMQSLAEEDPERRPFAILLVVRLAERNLVEICPVAFRANYEPAPIDVSISTQPGDEMVAKPRSWVKRLFVPSPKLHVVIARATPGVEFARDRPAGSQYPTGGRRSEKRK